LECKIVFSNNFTVYTAILKSYIWSPTYVAERKTTHCVQYAIQPCFTYYLKLGLQIKARFIF